MPAQKVDYLENFDPKYDDLITKVKIGEERIDFCLIQSCSPIFSFDYISLNKSEYCFNYSNVVIHDYHILLKKLKKMSNLSYSSIHDESGTGYRFHIIHGKERRFLSAKLKLHIDKDTLDDSEIPEFYQFELYTNPVKNVAPRIIGFIGRLGVFFLLWLDYNHQTYS